MGKRLKKKIIITLLKKELLGSISPLLSRRRTSIFESVSIVRRTDNFVFALAQLAYELLQTSAHEKNKRRVADESEGGCSNRGLAVGENNGRPKKEVNFKLFMKRWITPVFKVLSNWHVIAYYTFF